MPMQIALTWCEKAGEELVEMGFEKREVYVKYVLEGVNSKEGIEIGDRAFFAMTHTPYQFVTVSWWGMGPE